jgi:hypothetical protein
MICSNLNKTSSKNIYPTFLKRSICLQVGLNPKSLKNRLELVFRGDGLCLGGDGLWFVRWWVGVLGKLMGCVCGEVIGCGFGDVCSVGCRWGYGYASQSEDIYSEDTYSEESGFWGSVVWEVMGFGEGDGLWFWGSLQGCGFGEVCRVGCWWGYGYASQSEDIYSEESGFWGVYVGLGEVWRCLRWWALGKCGGAWWAWRVMSWQLGVEACSAANSRKCR